MNVLDVGSATGFFAFEFERRGASVVSVDLPSVAEWDIPHVDRERELRELSSYHNASSGQETNHSHLDGPFLFCKKVLGSKVKRVYSRIYDLTPAKLGAEAFDLIFLGDVLGHLFAPLKALDVLAPLCRGRMVLSQDLVKAHSRTPLLWYIGSDTSGFDNRSWWIPNQLCLEQMLKRVGFKQVEVVGRHFPIIRRHWKRGDRFLIHATK
jgi:SAM-dependent methyltransferase